ncbi:MAG: carbamoyl-phosphate synthase large subunit [Thermosipho sp. (in: thermotogales)]|jgi:carbamoyl-phosphate synthase large subunit|nr:carbamoyl-phosphate synthase large subunit [Thermosipho sp. (in: thermotogales)]
MINILFLSVGRRVELIQEFIKAKNSRKIEGKILGVDMDPLSPALYFVDNYYIVPSVKENNYIDKLIEICKKESISLIVPTIDTELYILSENRNLFEKIGVNVLISSENVIKISRNKWETYNFFKSLGLKTPKSYIEGMEYAINYPCFIKPISGSSSVNAFKVKNEIELEFYKYHIGDYILQEYINGTEYTIDVFCDFDGNPIFITPRIRLAVRSGEVIKTKISNEDKLIDQVLLIINNLKPKGPLTIQAIKSFEDNHFYFIEINARFGGGAPLSMKAGANSAEALYDILNGKKLEFKRYAAKDGLIFLRFDQSIIIEKDEKGNYEKI